MAHGACTGKVSPAMLWILALTAALLGGAFNSYDLVKGGPSIAPHDVLNGGPTTAPHGSTLTPSDVVNGGPTT
jgi:hypothetical protein